ncbi:MAG TPA: potassium transporter Kup [Verrucomicrobiales bacterium]|nr:potassium transporter Kup [Verrucomicrobiales bacterium]
MSQPDSSLSHSRRLWVLVLGALGVVFGDIGTSPLYALRECFVELDITTHAEHRVVMVDRPHIIGALSLIIWTLTLMITLKYIFLVMKADRRGEGGILALQCVAFPERKNRWRTGTGKLMVGLGVFGAALLYGDGIITPAITVLGAVEGLKESVKGMDHYVLPISVIILVCLFLVQRFGTAKIGAAFGPITLVWFVVLAVLGISWVVRAPEVLAAFNPIAGLKVLFETPHIAIKMLSGVFLTVTGGEALYADMGHFGRKPIAKGWLFLVKPALILHYLGQGAFLLHDPEGIKNPIQLMSPEWFRVPLLILATMAAIIASQALISGVYSLTMQAVQLGYLPRVKIEHTSHMEKGQIYIARVNWLLMFGCIGLVVGFGSSQRLASAYGIAVALTMLITTALLYFAARRKWEWSPAKTLGVIAIPLVLSLVFVLANSVKFFHGGWVPVCIGVGLFTVMVTWRTGRRLLGGRLQEQALPLRQFLESIKRGHKITRVPGTAVFMAGSSGLTPTALLHNLKHNKVLHERVLFLTIDSETTPHVEADDRLTLEEIEDNVYRIIGHYGFMEQPDVPELLELCEQKGLKLDPMQTSFFLGRETIIPKGQLLSKWRGKLFGVLSRNAQSAVAYYNIPPGRVVEFGIQIEL